MNLISAIEFVSKSGEGSANNFESLKKLYKRAAFNCHPDRNGSEVTMKKLNMAWKLIAKNPNDVNAHLQRTDMSILSELAYSHELAYSTLPTLHSKHTLVRQAFTIIDDLKWGDWSLCRFNTVYFSKYQVRIHTYSSSVRITMLQNALETGKSCIQYCISWGSGFDAEGYLKFLNWLSLISESKCITSLLAHLKIAKYYDSPDGNESCAELEQGLKVVKIEVNARQVFSPFKLERIKPLTVIPEKPNAGHLIKLLANGQYRFLRQDYKYTDDYSFDASDDFGKKVFENPFRLLSDLIENRGKGFTVFRSADEFSFGPHSNDSKSLKPVIDNRFPSFDIPDLEKHSLT